MSRTVRIAAVCSLLAFAVVGCGEDGVVEPTGSGFTEGLQESRLSPQAHTSPQLYEVTITNLTYGQPFSPPVAATHRGAIQMMPQRGTASPGLEAIAEDGNNALMLSTFQGSAHVTEALDVAAPVHYKDSPHGANSVTFMIEGRPGDRFSFAAMLIATNDGFTGVRGHMLPRDVVTFDTYAYDAGTEDNTEASSDIVDAATAIGPVALAGDPNGNENDAVDTTPHSRISRHPGIQGSGDLGDAHDWSGAVARVTLRKVAGPMTYRVTLRNLSAYQPISPPVVVTHAQGMHLFRTGHTASPGIEAIAEDGNGAPLISALDGASGVTEVVDVGMPLTRAGTSVGGFMDTAEIMITAMPGDRLSLAGMLICTNDGFVGVDSAPLPVHSRTLRLTGLDAGTEENTEASADIVDACGALGAVALPADGNENAAVDTQPRQRIRRHRGIHGAGDLSQGQHGWKGTILEVTVERVPE